MLLCSKLLNTCSKTNKQKHPPQTTKQWVLYKDWWKAGGEKKTRAAFLGDAKPVPGLREGGRSQLALNAVCKLKLGIGHSMASSRVWGRYCMAVHAGRKQGRRASDVSRQLGIISLAASEMLHLYIASYMRPSELENWRWCDEIWDS